MEGPSRRSSRSGVLLGNRLINATAVALAIGSLAVARAARPGQRDQKPPIRSGSGLLESEGEEWVNESSDLAAPATSDIGTSLLGLDALGARSGLQATGGAVLNGSHLPGHSAKQHGRHDAHLRRSRNDLVRGIPAGHGLDHAMQLKDYAHLPHILPGLLGLRSSLHKVGRSDPSPGSGDTDSQGLVDEIVVDFLKVQRLTSNIFEPFGMQRLSEGNAALHVALLKVPRDKDHAIRQAIQRLEEAVEVCTTQPSDCNPEAMKGPTNVLEDHAHDKNQLQQLAEEIEKALHKWKEIAICGAHVPAYMIKHGLDPQHPCATRKEVEDATDRIGEGCTDDGWKFVNRMLCEMVEIAAPIKEINYAEVGKEGFETKLFEILAEPKVAELEKDFGEIVVHELGMTVFKLIAMETDEARGKDPPDPDVQENHKATGRIYLNEAEKVLDPSSKLLELARLYLKDDDAEAQDSTGEVGTGEVVPGEQNEVVSVGGFTPAETEAPGHCSNFCHKGLKLSPSNFAHKDLVINDHDSSLYSRYWKMRLMTCKQFHTILVDHGDKLCMTPLEQMADRHNANLLLKMWPQIMDNCCEDEQRGYYHTLEALKRSLQGIESHLRQHEMDMKSADVKVLMDELQNLLQETIMNLHFREDDFKLDLEEKNILIDVMRDTSDRMQVMLIKLKQSLRKEEFLSKANEVLELLDQLLKEVEGFTARFRDEVLKVNEASFEKYQENANKQLSNEVTAASGGEGGEGSQTSGRHRHKKAGLHGKDAKIKEVKVEAEVWLKTGVQIELSFRYYVGNYSLYMSHYWDYIRLELYIEKLYNQISAGDSGNATVVEGMSAGLDGQMIGRSVGGSADAQSTGEAADTGSTGGAAETEGRTDVVDTGTPESGTPDNGSMGDGEGYETRGSGELEVHGEARRSKNSAHRQKVVH